MKRFVMISLIFFSYVTAWAIEGVVVVKDSSVSKQEKEAVLVLVGLGRSKKGYVAQKTFFEKMDFDVFIPDYIQRKSYEASYQSFVSFFEKHQLSEYKKIHVFSYIAGSWTINRFVHENGMGNISSILYDRSPLQERIPFAMNHKIPLLTKLVVGNVLRDFSKIPYQSIPDSDSLTIGIMIESKASTLARKFRTTVEGVGPYRWEIDFFEQEYDDYCYTSLDHSEMYYRFDISGEAIAHFFKYGQFPAQAKREMYDWDPYEKLN